MEWHIISLVNGLILMVALYYMAKDINSAMKQHKKKSDELLEEIRVELIDVKPFGLYFLTLIQIKEEIIAIESSNKNTASGLASASEKLAICRQKFVELRSLSVYSKRAYSKKDLSSMFDLILDELQWVIEKYVSNPDAFTNYQRKVLYNANAAVGSCGNLNDLHFQHAVETILNLKIHKLLLQNAGMY